jgi:hypothetical protein
LGEAKGYPEDPVSEAIKILEDSADLREARNETENTQLPDKDDDGNAEIDKSEGMSTEQGFWFKLARSDIDETG